MRRERVERLQLARVRPLERDLEIRQERIVGGDVGLAGAARGDRASGAARGAASVSEALARPACCARHWNDAPTATPTKRPAAAAAAIQRGAVRAVDASIVRRTMRPGKLMTRAGRPTCAIRRAICCCWSAQALGREDGVGLGLAVAAQRRP